MKLPVSHILPIAALILIAGCAGPQARLEPVASSGPAADYPVVTGTPFTIGTVDYTPVDALNYDAVGHAAIGSDGGSAVTIAHKTLPMPSYAEVTALDSGKTILVRVERRGPMRNDRLVELSPGAAAQLVLIGQAGAPIRIRRVNPPELDRALLRIGQRAPERMETPPGLLAVLMRKLGPHATPPVMPPAIATVTPRPTPAPQALPKARAADGALVVQIGAFANQQNATAAASRLGAHVRPAGRLSRVVLGPFADRSAAQGALAKVRLAGYSDARIQRAD